MFADTVDQANNVTTNVYVVTRFIKQHIPFYFDEINPTVNIEFVELKNFAQQLQFVLTESYTYDLTRSR